MKNANVNISTIANKARKTFWPNKDDAAERIFEKYNSNDKDYELKFSPKILSYGQKAITVVALATTLYAANSKFDIAKNAKNFFKEQGQKTIVEFYENNYSFKSR